MNLLTIVNKVLIRLREEPVTSVLDNPYSQLIVEFVNTTKREVEDAWQWTALDDSIIVNTSNNVSTYALQATETRAKIQEVINTTSGEYLTYQSSTWFSSKMQLDTPEQGVPKYFGYDGVDANGDIQIVVYPIPDGVYALNFNVWNPQPDLTTNTSELLVPSRIVIEGVVSKAISERGDDGGYSEQENRYILALGDYIAAEANSREEEITWGAK
jgi:hypothetical protein